MNQIIIDNITEKDAQKHYVRVLKENKHLFPADEGGYTVHTLKFQIMGDLYLLDYKIGDDDDRERSGVLRLGQEIFDLLKIEPGSILKVVKVGNELYTITS